MTDTGQLRQVPGVDSRWADDTVPVPTRVPAPRESGDFTRRDLPSDPIDTLARLASQGDAEATQELLRRMAPRLLALGRSLLGAGNPDVDDIVQEMLLAVVHAIPAFEGRSSFNHYAMRIGVRVGLAERRRRRTEARRMMLTDEADELSGLPPGETPVRSRRKVVVRQLLDGLSEVQAETMALRVCLGMSLDEVAEATGVPTNTVRSRLRLARLALQRRIKRDPALTELLETTR